jgi:hypothetical protein
MSLQEPVGFIQILEQRAEVFVNVVNIPRTCDGDMGCL